MLFGAGLTGPYKSIILNHCVQKVPPPPSRGYFGSVHNGGRVSKGFSLCWAQEYWYPEKDPRVRVSRFEQLPQLDCPFRSLERAVEPRMWCPSTSWGQSPPQENGRRFRLGFVRYMGVSAKIVTDVASIELKC